MDKLMTDERVCMKAEQHLVLFGGGIDSTAVALHLLQLPEQENVLPTLVHVDYGQKAVEAERRSQAHLANKYGLDVVHLKADFSFSSAKIMQTQGVGITPESNRLEMRNVALISIVAAYAASTAVTSTLYVGFHVEPPSSTYLDATTQYLSHLETVFSMTTTSAVCLRAPLSMYTRQAIFDMAMLYDQDFVNYSHTCYEVQECGLCPHCTQKQEMVSNHVPTTNKGNT